MTERPTLEWAYDLAERVIRAIEPHDAGFERAVRSELDCEGPDGPIELGAQMAWRLGVVLPDDIIADLQTYAETFAADNPKTSQHSRDLDAKTRCEIARAIQYAKTGQVDDDATQH